ncbi:MAG: DNA recombination protein RmuC [Paracoccus denitrificans]|nr:MAG: DNA recombination protein RmuC [Paracoccus denitrificans]PZO84814.1 MAG: DNA recombination protein RmuC [Paracoccus denitrificans]
MLWRRGTIIEALRRAYEAGQARIHQASLTETQAVARANAHEARLNEVLSERETLRSALEAARAAEQRHQDELHRAGLRDSDLRARFEAQETRFSDLAQERDGLRTELDGLRSSQRLDREELNQSGIRESDLRVRLEGHASRLGELSQERDKLSEAVHAARTEVEELTRVLAETRLIADKDKKSAERELALLREIREEMTGQFRLMADESLRRQALDLEKTHSDRLAAMLTPFREQVQGFQTELQARNKSVDEERAALREQIEGLHRRSEEIGRDAVALTRALKGEKQRQGAWGEMILERVLEGSGLEQGTHYKTQESWRDEGGKTWRPDVVVYLPRKKVLVVDSKVSLNDYEVAVNGETEAERDAALRRHVAAVRNHINTLSEKGYHQIDNASVDYVLMFIPIEGALSEAMRFDPMLASYALERRIGLSTPTTLMLTLRTVDHIWTVERRESNALDIATRAGALYDKVALFVNSMEDVGKALDGATRAHGQAMDRLTRGGGNVIGQVEKLRVLGARAQKRMSIEYDGDQDEQGLIDAAE